MAYIYLDELKEILPGILDQWIDKDDESWEWIFQEIEQKCHIGKKKKDKKPKKKDMQNAMEIAIMAHRNDINELNDKFNKLNDICNAHTVRLDCISKDLSDIKRITLKDLSNRIEQVRSMAQTAKQRTEVDYSKYSGKSDGEKMCKTCKYSSNIDGSPKSFDIPPCDSCNYNNNWEAKENE